ncbi:MAG: dihydrofolate reductase [Betaproteobacteria bacterium]|nr:dihydrofolate reductase [Betaproteobacteria bacterium]
MGHRPYVCIVAALSSNGVIGANGKLPWQLPEDLKHFKALTLGHAVIMGRRTWESIGKPLPERENIVVTRERSYQALGARTAGSLEAALASCVEKSFVFVIGGGEVYAAALPLTDLLVLTEIHLAAEGDVRFPDYSRLRWRETLREPQTAADGTRFDYVLYERRR